MLTPRVTSTFKKQYRLLQRQGKDMSKLDSVISKLCRREQLPPSNHDHKLVGFSDGRRECHVQPDWLLIYRVDDNVLELVLIQTGSHSELFGK